MPKLPGLIRSGSGAAIFKQLTNRIPEGDISAWGIAALMSGAIAVFSANVAGFIPDSVLAGLHTTRLEAGNINQIGAQMNQLRSDTQRTSRDYRTLLSRFDLLDDDSGETVRRLAAVERSLPLLIESLPLDSDIDRSLLTASIASTSGEVYEENGVTIIVRQSPLFEGIEEKERDDTAGQPLPPELAEQNVPVAAARPETTARMQGIAIGELVSRTEALDEWNEIVSQVGPLLLGTVPLLADTGDAGETRVVVGPLPDLASAEALCTRLDRSEIACDPVPYEGLRWPH